MKLTTLSANAHILSLPNGIEVLFSYAVPVAGYIPEQGYFRTEEHYSNTTTRHINQYIPNVVCKSVTQDYINNLLHI
jgi:hypothetical protein